MWNKDKWWGPNDEQNPYQVKYKKILALWQWRELIKLYPFSIRTLTITGKGCFWYENARAISKQNAKDIMMGLTHRYRVDPLVHGYVVIKCISAKEEDRETPVFWYPSREDIEAKIDTRVVEPEPEEADEITTNFTDLAYDEKLVETASEANQDEEDHQGEHSPIEANSISSIQFSIK